MAKNHKNFTSWSKTSVEQDPLGIKNILFVYFVGGYSWDDSFKCFLTEKWS